MPSIWEVIPNISLGWDTITGDSSNRQVPAGQSTCFTAFDSNLHTIYKGHLVPNRCKEVLASTMLKPNAKYVAMSYTYREKVRDSIKLLNAWEQRLKLKPTTLVKHDSPALDIFEFNPVWASSYAHATLFGLIIRGGKEYHFTSIPEWINCLRLNDSRDSVHLGECREYLKYVYTKKNLLFPGMNPEYGIVTNMQYFRQFRTATATTNKEKYISEAVAKVSSAFDEGLQKVDVDNTASIVSGASGSDMTTIASTVEAQLINAYASDWFRFPTRSAEVVIDTIGSDRAARIQDYYGFIGSSRSYTHHIIGSAKPVNTTQLGEE